MKNWLKAAGWVSLAYLIAYLIMRLNPFGLLAYVAGLFVVLLGMFFTLPIQESHPNAAFHVAVVSNWILYVVILRSIMLCKQRNKGFR